MGVFRSHILARDLLHGNVAVVLYSMYILFNELYYGVLRNQYYRVMTFIVRTNRWKTLQETADNTST